MSSDDWTDDENIIDDGWADDNTESVKSRPIEAAIEGFGQGASLGYGNELAAALEQVTFPVASFLTGQDVKADSYLEARDKYAARSKKLEQENPGEYISGNLFGNLATGIATAPLTVAKGATALAKVGNAARIGALQGAAMDVDSVDGEYGLGAKDRLKNLATGGFLGGAFQTGANALSKTPEYLQTLARSRAVKALGPGKKQMVELQKKGKIQDLGKYLLENKAIKAGDSIDDIVTKTTALESGAGSKLNDVYQRAGELFERKSLSGGFDPLRDKEEILAAAKKELGETVGTDSAIAKLSNYLDEVASRHGDKPYQQALRKYEGELADYNRKQSAYLAGMEKYKGQLGDAADPNQPALPFMIDDLQRTGKSNIDVELFGKDASKMAPEMFDPNGQLQMFEMPTGQSEAARLYARPGEANFGHAGGDTASRLGQRTTDALGESAQGKFLNDRFERIMTNESRPGRIEGLSMTPRSFDVGDVPSIKSSSGQLEMPIMPDAPVSPQIPSDIRNPMMPRSAQEVKTALDREINYARNPLLKDPASEKAFYGARSKIAEKTEKQIEELGGTALGDELRSANKDYGFATTAKGISEDKLARESVNRDISLTDYLSGVGGANIGQLPGAIAGAALNKIGRGYGNAAIADYSNRISKALLKSPQWAKVAKDNPQVFSQLVNKMTSQALKENENSSFQNQEQNSLMLDKDSIMNKVQGTKYQQVLQNAAKKGDQSFASANYVLGQRDPEYRKLISGGFND